MLGAVWAGVCGVARAQTSSAQGAAAWTQIKTVPELLRALGAHNARESAQIELQVPELADQGAVVPVTVRSAVPRTDQITLLVPGNPAPWVASFELFAGTEPLITTRIKMSQSSAVLALIRAEGRFYMARREVRVTQGGCGA
jgi:sulfur-oxidizing protein SoxY